MNCVMEAEVEIVVYVALKDRYGDWHLAVGRRPLPKKRIHDYGGSRQKSLTARGRLTCRAVPAPRKGHGCQGQSKDNDVQ
jgi:hypothetical protein